MSSWVARWGSAWCWFRWARCDSPQYDSAAGRSSRVGAGEPPLLGARNEPQIHMAACCAPKGPLLEGFGLGFGIFLRRKVGRNCCVVISIVVRSVSPGKRVGPLGVAVALGVSVRQGWMQP